MSDQTENDQYAVDREYFLQREREALKGPREEIVQNAENSAQEFLQTTQTLSENYDVHRGHGHPDKFPIMRNDTDIERIQNRIQELAQDNPQINPDAIHIPRLINEETHLNAEMAELVRAGVPKEQVQEILAPSLQDLADEPPNQTINDISAGAPTTLSNLAQTSTNAEFEALADQAEPHRLAAITQALDNGTLSTDQAQQAFETLKYGGDKPHINYDPQDPVAALNQATLPAHADGQSWEIVQEKIEGLGNRHARLTMDNPEQLENIQAALNAGRMTVLEGKVADKPTLFIPEEELDNLKVDLGITRAMMDVMDNTPGDPATVPSLTPEVVPGPKINLN